MISYLLCTIASAIMITIATTITSTTTVVIAIANATGFAITENVTIVFPADLKMNVNTSSMLLL